MLKHLIEAKTVLLSNLLRSQFDFLESEKGFSKEVTPITNIVEEITYKCENIEIQFYVEEMEDYFEFRIKIHKNDSIYWISDTTQRFTNDKRIITCDIFNFTHDFVKTDFIKNRKNLFRKSKRWFLYKSAQAALVKLYRDLLFDCYEQVLEYSKIEVDEPIVSAH